jgi:hypothetical protein
MSINTTSRLFVLIKELQLTETAGYLKSNRLNLSEEEVKQAEEQTQQHECGSEV